MKPRRIACASAALLFACTAPPIATLALEQPTTRKATVPATVIQPRSFGFTIADVVTQRILLPERFEPDELTTPQRVSLWFERRASRTESTPDGRRWLVVDYQVMNAPRTLGTVSLPAWDLVARDGARLRVAAAPIGVGALIPEDAPAASEQLRPDRPPPVVPTASMRTRLHVAVLALAITLAAWLAWVPWRNWRERTSLPFARALHEMRNLGDAAPQTWQVLHRAFDRTAGHVVQLENLPTLFQRAPHLRPLDAQIERFFSQSSERFFGVGLRQEPVSAQALCRELRRLEKRYAQ